MIVCLLTFYFLWKGDIGKKVRLANGGDAVNAHWSKLKDVKEFWILVIVPIIWPIGIPAYLVYKLVTKNSN